MKYTDIVYRMSKSADMKELGKDLLDNRTLQGGTLGAATGIGLSDMLWDRDKMDAAAFSDRRFALTLICSALGATAGAVADHYENKTLS